MSMPFIYAVTHQVSPPVVYAINQSGGADQLGNPLAGSPPAESHTISDNRTNTVVNFNGGIYCWHRDTIREIDSDGAGGTSVGNWGIVYTTSQTGGGENLHSGLYVISADGVPTLCGMFRIGNDVLGLKSTDGVTFTETTGPQAAIVSVGRARVFNNELYWTTNLASVIRYTPLIDLIELVPITPAIGGITTARDFCALNNKFFMAGLQGSGFNSTFSLWELGPGGFERTHSFTQLQGGNQLGRYGCPSIFTKSGSELYLQFSGEVLSGALIGAGDISFQVLNPGLPSQSVAVNESLSVIPLFFKPTEIHAIGRSRYYIFVDNEVHEDRINGSITAPDLFQFHTGNPESTAGLPPVAGNYQINPLTGGSFMTGFISNEFTLSTATFGGGARINRSVNKVYVTLENPVPGSVSGTTDVSFRVYGSGSNFTGTAYFSSQQSWIENIATLTGSVTGGSASRSGNNIINITADSGATLYTFIWDHSTDGITNGVPLRMNIELL